MRSASAHKSALAALLRGCIVVAAAGLAGATDARIELLKSPQGPVFEVKGLSGLSADIGVDAARDAFRVYVDSAEGAPPMAGSYQLASNSIRFTPRFPLQAGASYRAEFRSWFLSEDRTGVPLTRVFNIAARPPTPPTAVEAIFPSGPQVPENLLKFYVYFSASMTRGDVYRHVRLERTSGEKVDLAFLEISEELWDPDLKRLTLLFDPGRIKRELRPNKEVGTALVEGEKYRLIISQDWRDAQGNPLSESGVKEFAVGPPDRVPPETSSWRMSAPRVATKDALEVNFPEPLDQALLQRLLTVVDRRGRPVPGTVSVGSQETQWTFTPLSNWEDSKYELTVATVLEDLAGNTLDRPFEVDVFERVEDRITQAHVRLPIALLRE